MKLHWSFLLYCAVYLSETLQEQEQMWAGLDCIRGELIGWLDGCGLLLADLMWVTGYSPALVIREEKRCCKRNWFSFNIINTIMMMCTYNSFTINTQIPLKKTRIVHFDFKAPVCDFGIWPQEGAVSTITKAKLDDAMKEVTMGDVVFFNAFSPSSDISTWN